MIFGKIRALIVCAVTAGVLASTVVSAAADDAGRAAKPGGRPLLTVLGAIEKGDGQKVTFDRAAMEAMPVAVVETKTPWTEGVTRFEGVRLTDILARVGASGKEVVATAVNDYAVTLPVEDENGAEPVIAYKMNGKPMSLRDKGPLWIVYPFDSDRNLEAEKYYSRSIWQLKSLTVR